MIVFLALSGYHFLNQKEKMQNIEIKYHTEQLAELQNFLVNSLKITHEFRHRQRDIYFAVPEGRLKIRIQDEQQPHLIRYFRPDIAETRISDYTIEMLDDAEQTITELQQKHHVLATVEKVRTLFLYKNVRIHLDEVALLGDFVEFESVISDSCDAATAQRNLDEIMQLLQPYLGTPESGGYLNLLLAHPSTQKGT
ncbi:MAG: class IV adenylate cyclase [Calditrichia bacterium]